MLFDDLCFDAQQAAEKAIKAVLVSKRTRFPKTHDLAELLDLVAGAGVGPPPRVLEAKRLTPYAVAERYPGSEDASEQDYPRHAGVGQREASACGSGLRRPGAARQRE